MTEDPVDITGENPKETRRYLEMIRRDLRRLPILDLRRIRWAKPPWDPKEPGKSFSSIGAMLKDLRLKNRSATISSVTKDVSEAIRKTRRTRRD